MAPHTKHDGPERRKLPTPDDLRAHFDARFDELAALIKSGFPDGDPAAHRMVHEGYIKAAKQRDELRQAVLKQVLTGGVYATLIFLGTLGWAWFKNEVKK